MRNFAATYILIGGPVCLFSAGFFYAHMLPKYGSVPPCNSVIGLLPIRCKSTGQAEPFFISATNKQTKIFVMTYTKKKSLSVKDSNPQTTSTGTKSGNLKIFPTFVATNIPKGGKIRLLLAGFFYACTLIRGVTPVGNCNRTPALWVLVNGSVTPFFCYHNQILFWND